jgi:TldD protein
VSHSRREFLRVASAAAALTAIGERAQAQRLTKRVLDTRALRGIEDPDFRQLAMRALDAAKSAGATYADVRIELSLEQEHGIRDHAADLPLVYKDYLRYGVRVLAGGQWGFAGGIEPDADAIAQVAQRAVAQAKIDAAGRKRPVELAPAPVVTGSWDPQVDIDPFTVPVDEQQNPFHDGVESAFKVKGITLCGARIYFSRARITFASTEGSFTNQTLYLASASSYAATPRLDDKTEYSWAAVESLGMAQRGWELVRNVRLPEEMTQAAEQAMREARLGARSVDVGRYDLVMDPSVVGAIIEKTLGEATGADRVLGKKQNGAGTSFAAPPQTALGAMQIGSSLLSLTGERSSPHGIMTVGWDDEGVKPQDVLLIDHGILNNYQTTRETAAELGWWQTKHGQPVHSVGATSGSGLTRPREMMMNFVMSPGSDNTTAEDMIKDVKKGLYLTEYAYGGSDQQVINSSFVAGKVQEIRNGKLVGFIKDSSIQFRTQQFWKAVDAIGGAASSRSYGYGEPGDARTIRSVPARVRNIDVINTGRIE